LPIGEAATFKGFVDLVRMKAFEYSDDGSVADTAIPADLQAECEEARGKLIEAAAEADDALLEKYFDAGELTPDEVRDGLGKAIANRVLFPVFVTGATKCSGAAPLMDFAAHYFPSAALVGKMNVLKGEELTEIEVGADKPALAFVFKTLIEKHVGELTMARVYSGTLKPGMEISNPGRGATEKLGQMFALRGKERIDVECLPTGDLGALVKLKETQTGDTLCDKSLGVIVPPIEYPSPSIEFAVKAVGKGDEEKMSGGLNGLRREDPTFQYEVNGELKQTILRGQGEQHLDVVASKLRHNYGIEVELFEPRIPYRETITKKTETQYRYKKQTGGRGQYGDVHLRLEPLPRGSGFEFADEITGGVIPQKFIPAVEKGVVEAMHEGALSGNQVVDIKVALFFGSYHTVDSSEQAFKTAGLMAFRQAFQQCDPVLLEPIYDLEVQVPEDYTGDIMGDLSSRRGKVMGMEPKGKFTLIKGQAPLAELFKYSTSLRSMTGGRARHVQRFSHYDPVPREVTEKIVEAHKAAREADK
ncbi:MAG: elongation factor G, partial [bacterium]